MIVTGIEKLTGGKSKVYLDEQFAFVLYRGELSRYGVVAGKELSEEQYRRIEEEVLWLRIRKRCLFLLKDMDRSEAQIRQKLKGDFYQEILIERVILWLQDLHYLDDFRYARNYVRFRKEKKSRSQLRMELAQKGVAPSAIEAAFEEEELPDEKELIRRFLEKKGIRPSELDFKEKRKIYGALQRKGFSGSAISGILNGMEEFD